MNIIAGIVLYNPDIQRLKENIDAILAQVNEIVLVDNASNNKSEILDLLGRYDNCIMIENSDNMGIAFALNRIFEYANEKKCEWFLTLDQDTVCYDKLIQNYIQVIEKIDITKVGMLTCIADDRNYVLENSFSADDDYKEVTYCITSGALVNTKAAKECDGWKEVLFIDNVDGEFCIHLKKLGYKVISLNYHGILHEVGHGQNVRFLWKKDVVYNHPAIRHYYVARNKIYVARMYPDFFNLKEELKKEKRHIRKVWMYEKDKKNKVAAIKKGVKDGLELPL